jgi:tRNA(Ile)-lysidine synthase TilS/MesJ
MAECIRCLFNTTDISGLQINDQGICEYCELHDQFNKQYPAGQVGRRLLDDLFLQIHKDGKNRQFDCVVGLSGGCDSSYVLHLARTFGLRVLGVHYDNGMNTNVAERNMATMCNLTGTPLLRFKPSIHEVNDVWRAFLLSGAPDVEAPTDLALTKCIYEACERHKIKYILDGHNFRTEGWVPKGMSYMDGRYVRDVHRRLGTIPLKEFPQLTLWDMIKFSLKGVKRVRPLYHIDRSPTDMRADLKTLYNWENYGGKHQENKFTAWFGTYYRPLKSKFDSRIVHLSALARSGYTKKEYVKRAMDQAEPVHKAYAAYIEDALGVSHEGMIELTKQPDVSVSEFKNYRRHFKMLKPFFYVAYKFNLIPKTFYLKYVK